ncbi:beta/gamma crystallin domain-containing protein [Streptomyces olivoreticuli]|uniref:beta/gamma crystallin domain-containing protein n=1 Tax=Streptomyces olivoreticuli TaxID=68246 RepID=UPI0013C34D2D|nr:beta/gamma crystallin domain-containing protein [Streptomyces olivoreticuli]
MKMLRLIATLTATAALALTGVASGGTAFAAPTPRSVTNITDITNPPCGNRTDFVRVYAYSRGDTCYANAGYTTPNITAVYRVCSGNNDISIGFNAESFEISRNNCQDFGGGKYLTRLQIW